ETREVTFSIDKSALSFYDDKTHSWTAEKGKFSAFIGLSAGEIGKAVKFELK
ncbi:MAG: fibronectin type III-like domain-contianing protein, partial [Bacteroidales bacterium]|nr:fibronectin type III-like domain-contianing protein [Bacteroidales bacterium]